MTGARARNLRSADAVHALSPGWHSRGTSASESSNKNIISRATCECLYLYDRRNLFRCVGIVSVVLRRLWDSVAAGLNPPGLKSGCTDVRSVRIECDWSETGESLSFQKASLRTRSSRDHRAINPLPRYAAFASAIRSSFNGRRIIYS